MRDVLRVTTRLAMLAVWALSPGAGSMAAPVEGENATTAPASRPQPPPKVDLSTTNQYYLHGVLANRDTFSELFVNATHGTADHRLDWHSDQAYTSTPVNPASGYLFRNEVQRLADQIEQDYRKDGRRIFLHGHSAGGVMASALAQELDSRGVQVAGMATYGTPQTTLRFHDDGPPAKIPPSRRLLRPKNAMLGR